MMKLKRTTKKVKEIASNSVLRYKSDYTENLYKVTSKIENDIIPETISIQKGLGFSGNKTKK